jgi:hypothetical protein
LAVLPPATRSAQTLSSNLTHASSRAITRPTVFQMRSDNGARTHRAPYSGLRYTHLRLPGPRSFGKLGGAFRGVGSDSCEAVMILAHECRAHHVTCVRLGADPDISIRGEASTLPAGSLTFHVLQDAIASGLRHSRNYADEAHGPSASIAPQERLRRRRFCGSTV